MIPIIDTMLWKNTSKGTELMFKKEIKARKKYYAKISAIMKYLKREINNNVQYLRAQSERLEESVRKQYWAEKVQIDVLELEFGWETIRMTFNDRVIEYRASYVGEEPISSLIDAATALDECYDGYIEDVCYIQ